MTMCGIYEYKTAVPQARPGFPGWKDLKELEVSHTDSQQIQKFDWFIPLQEIWPRGTEWKQLNSPETHV